MSEALVFTYFLQSTSAGWQPWSSHTNQVVQSRKRPGIQTTHNFSHWCGKARIGWCLPQLLLGAHKHTNWSQTSGCCSSWPRTSLNCSSEFAVSIIKWLKGGPESSDAPQLPQRISQACWRSLPAKPAMSKLKTHALLLPVHQLLSRDACGLINIKLWDNQEHSASSDLSVDGQKDASLSCIFLVATSIQAAHGLASHLCSERETGLCR